MAIIYSFLINSSRFCFFFISSVRSATLFTTFFRQTNNASPQQVHGPDETVVSAANDGSKGIASIEQQFSSAATEKPRRLFAFGNEALAPSRQRSGRRRSGSIFRRAVDRSTAVATSCLRDNEQSAGDGSEYGQRDVKANQRQHCSQQLAIAASNSDEGFSSSFNSIAPNFPGDEETLQVQRLQGLLKISDGGHRRPATTAAEQSLATISSASEKTIVVNDNEQRFDRGNQSFTTSVPKETTTTTTTSTSDSPEYCPIEPYLQLPFIDSTILSGLYGVDSVQLRRKNNETNSNHIEKQKNKTRSFGFAYASESDFRKGTALMSSSSKSFTQYQQSDETSEDLPIQSRITAPMNDTIDSGSVPAPSPFTFPSQQPSPSLALVSATLL